MKRAKWELYIFSVILDDYFPEFPTLLSTVASEYMCLNCEWKQFCEASHQNKNMQDLKNLFKPFENKKYDPAAKLLISQVMYISFILSPNEML